MDNQWKVAIKEAEIPALKYHVIKKLRYMNNWIQRPELYGHISPPKIKRESVK